MGNPSRSLQDLYVEMSGMDKTAQAAAGVPATSDTSSAGGDFSELAAKLAAAEVDGADGGTDDATQTGEEKTAEEQEFIKQAAEFDAAGRFMARGFYDELNKLAGAMDTAVAPNQRTESESRAQTPALGPKGLPTVETNFAGAENHDQGIDTKGGKEVYKDSLAPSKTIKPGVTGDDPEAAAISAGSGSPAGFATVRDLMNMGG